MTITDELIEKAERILLPNGRTFDDERRDFIKGLDNRDLMAVPGSGKTTALQAKLYCIAQNMPLSDGRGILVLSHTNTAVDELKRLLQGYCPQLFEYPNFVGTIQQFVDRFLAIPFYEACTGKNIESIDADRYCKECDKYVNRGRGFAANYVKYHIASDNKHYCQVRFSYNDEGQIIITMGLNGKTPTVVVPQTWKNAHKEEENTRAVISFLENMKKNLMQNGFLHYDDCYFLADSYLKRNPSVIPVLRNRFRYVFVDEAQDTHKHQLDLLNRLFGGAPCDCLQLIGDPNQSIFNNHSRSTTLQWRGKNPRYINKSIRLTFPVASVVNNLVSDRGHDDATGDNHFCVDGLRTLPVAIAPQLILFDNRTMGRLKGRFKDLIREYNLVEEDRTSNNGFHIIGWAAKKSNDLNKLHLEDIFQEYNYSPSETAFTADTLSKVIRKTVLRGNFKASHRTVIETFLHVLHLCGAKAEDGRGYNKTKLAKSLVVLPESEQKKYNEDLYNCSKELAAGNYEEAYNKIKEFVTTWIFSLFRVTPNDNARAYLEDAYVVGAIAPAPALEAVDDIPITIGTVHSVKGRTHCATMYVETFYEGKYECEHLNANKRGEVLNPLFGDGVVYSGVYAPLARKMMYVGFSRPTHLLCYASEKSRWNDEKLNKMRSQGWNVIDLTVV